MMCTIGAARCSPIISCPGPHDAGLQCRPPEPHVWGEDGFSQWRERLPPHRRSSRSGCGTSAATNSGRRGSVCEDPGAIQCPVYLVGGWADAYRDAVFRMLESLTVPVAG